MQIASSQCIWEAEQAAFERGETTSSALTDVEAGRIA